MNKLLIVILRLLIVTKNLFAINFDIRDTQLGFPENNLVIERIHIHQDNPELIVELSEGNIFIIDMISGQLKKSLKLSYPFNLHYDLNNPDNGKYFYVNSKNSKTIYKYDYYFYQQIDSIKLNDDFKFIKISNTGRYIAFFEYDFDYNEGSIELIDRITNESVDLNLNRKEVKNPEFSFDDKYIIFNDANLGFGFNSTYYRNSNHYLFDIEKNQFLMDYDLKLEKISNFNNYFLGTDNQNKSGIYNLISGELHKEIDSSYCNDAFDFASNGRHFVLGKEGRTFLIPISNFNGSDKIEILDLCYDNNKMLFFNDYKSLIYYSDHTINIFDTGYIFNSVDSKDFLNIDLYPNPSNNKIVLNLNKNERIENIKSVNQLGIEFVLEADKNVVNINKLKSGYYLLIIKTNQNQYLKNIIKN